ncbi:MAG: hypothetical protein JW863_23235 [Chitinispirillaceae bacterium]|nr:hypothetical protein [Chitinispirillaceae bacterium]
MKKMRTLLSAFVFLSVIGTQSTLAQAVVHEETDEEVSGANVSRPDSSVTLPPPLKETEIKSAPSRYMFGVALHYPVIFGGDDDAPDFWRKTWNGIFNVAVEFDVVVLNRLRIGPVLDFSLYKTVYSSLQENSFMMFQTAFSTQYDFIITPNESVILSPFANIGIAMNCFNLSYGGMLWDMGFLFSLGTSFSIRLPNRIEIGPVFQYDIIRRLYNLSDGTAVNSDTWIVWIRKFKIGVNAGFPILRIKNTRHIPDED